MGSLLQMHRAGQAATVGGDEPLAAEAALVERARGGDVEAWSRLYQDHFDRLYRHVAYLVGESHAAEDLVQETFAQAVVGLRQFGGRGSFLGWLRGIAQNLVRRHWRDHARGGRAMDRLGQMERGAHDRGPEGVYVRQQRVEVLLGVLDTLPPQLREAFVLCDMREVPVVEAAAELGISVNNLRVRATRARGRIRDELARLGWTAVDEREEGAGS